MTKQRILVCLVSVIAVITLALTDIHTASAYSDPSLIQTCGAEYID